MDFYIFLILFFVIRGIDYFVRFIMFQSSWGSTNGRNDSSSLKGMRSIFGEADKLKVCRNFEKVSSLSLEIQMIDDFLIEGENYSMCISSFIILRSPWNEFPISSSSSLSRLDALLRSFKEGSEESFFPFIGHDKLSISSVQIKFSRDGVSSPVIKSEFSRAIGEESRARNGAWSKKKGSWGKGKKQRGQSGEERRQKACRARTRQ